MPCWPAACDGVGFVCRFSLALALGVGQRRSSSVRFPPLDRVPEQARGVGQLVPFADGEDEEPLALVGRADFRRREEACRKAVAHADQSCGDFGEAEAEMMGDILEEDEGRLDLGDDARDMRPEVTRVVRAKPSARDRKWLTRIARYGARPITGFMQSTGLCRVGRQVSVTAPFSIVSLRIISGAGGGFQHGDQLVRGLEAAFLEDGRA